MTAIDVFSSSSLVSEPDCLGSDQFAFHAGRVTPKVTSAAQLVMNHLPDRAIIDRLSSWKRDPEALMDDDFEPPTSSVIDRALILARVALPSHGFRVYPGGEGDIVFEQSSPNSRVVFEVWPDGSVEVLVFKGKKLESRMQISLG